MATLDYRPPTEAEIATIGRRWSDTFGPKTSPIGEDKFVRVGRFPDAGVSPRLWYRAHELAIGEMLATSTVAVAVLESIPDMMVGWACFAVGDERTIVHFVHVDKEIRRRGIGRALLQYVHDHGAGLALRFSHTNRAGQILVESWTRRSKDPQP